jgi:hypothetical protein
MSAMMAAAPYEIRTGGDGKSKKQSMAELKLRRLTELNQRLREDLDCWTRDEARNDLANVGSQSHRVYRQGTKGLDGAIAMGNG